jgi:hypothetical protein
MKERTEIKCLQSDILIRCANNLSGFYGQPVYLVGSQLTKDDPRDVDIVIILPHDEFVLRYINQRETIGITNDEKCYQWGLRWKSGLYNESNWVWAKDVSHKCLQAMKWTSMYIDLKVLPLCYHLEHYSDHPILKISEDNFKSLLNKDQNDERIATQQASNQGGNAGINK